MSSKRRNEKLLLGLGAQCDFDKSSAESGGPAVRAPARFNLPLWVKWDGVCVHAQHTRCVL